MLLNPLGIVFFFKDTANTEIYTLSLHDALPIFAIRLSELEESVVIILGTLKRRRIAVLDEIGCFRCGAHLLASFSRFPSAGVGFNVHHETPLGVFVGTSGRNALNAGRMSQDRSRRR